MPTVRKKLTEAEERLNAYRGKSDSVNLDLETKSVLEQLVNIDNQLNQTQLEEAELSGKFNPSHPSYVALRKKRADLERTRSELEKQVGIFRTPSRRSCVWSVKSRSISRSTCSCSTRPRK
ncbi:hypothetical protein ACU8V3_11695 [Cobetia marina]